MRLVTFLECLLSVIDVELRPKEFGARHKDHTKILDAMIVAGLWDMKPLTLPKFGREWLALQVAAFTDSYERLIASEHLLPRSRRRRGPQRWSNGRKASEAFRRSTRPISWQSVIPRVATSLRCSTQRTILSSRAS